jgi:GDP-mannose 6-dehydrogenase
MNTVCEGRKLNIATAYLRSGFAFGGSCLPKDLYAVSYRASCLDVNLPAPAGQYRLASGGPSDTYSVVSRPGY